MFRNDWRGGNNFCFLNFSFHHCDMEYGFTCSLLGFGFGVMILSDETLLGHLGNMRGNIYNEEDEELIDEELEEEFEEDVEGFD